ncbi:MAG: hypothetical protein AAFN92_08855, partial [Bacteroidota bacterium]
MLLRTLSVYALGVFLLSCSNPEQELNEIVETNKVVLCDLDNKIAPFDSIAKLYAERNLLHLHQLRKSFSETTLAHAYTNYQISRVHRRQGRPDSADHYQRVALQQFMEGDTLVVQRASRILNTIASEATIPVHKRRYAEKGIELMLSYQDSCSYNRNLLIELHTYLADALIDLDNVANARRIAQNGLLHRQLSTDGYAVTNLYGELAEASLERADYLTAALMMDSAEAQLGLPDSIHPLDARDLMNIYDLRQNLALDTSNEAAASAYAQTALRIRHEYDPGSKKEAHSLNNYGRILLLNGNYRAGEKLINEALQLYTTHKSPLNRGTAFESLALSAELQNNIPEAIRWLDSAAVAYHGDPTQPGLENAIDRSELRDPLFTRARLLARDHFTHPERTSMANVEAAVTLVDSINLLLRHNVRTERSKRHIIRQTRELYEELITLFLQGYERTGTEKYQQRALFYLESAKARILDERRARLQGNRQVESSSAAQEVELRERIRTLRSEVANTKKSERRKKMLADQQRVEFELDQLLDARYQRATPLRETSFSET